MSEDKEQQEPNFWIMNEDDIVDLKELCKADPKLGCGSQVIQVNKKELDQMIAARTRRKHTWAASGEVASQDAVEGGE